MEDFTFEIYEDFILVIKKQFYKYQKTVITFNDILNNHKWKTAYSNDSKDENNRIISKFYFFKPHFNVYKERYTEEDLNILLEKINKNMVDNEYTFKFVHKKLYE